MPMTEGYLYAHFEGGSGAGHYSIDIYSSPTWTPDLATVQAIQNAGQAMFSGPGPQLAASGCNHLVVGQHCGDILPTLAERRTPDGGSRYRVSSLSDKGRPTTVWSVATTGNSSRTEAGVAR